MGSLAFPRGTVSVVAPFYNEETLLREFYRRLKTVLVSLDVDDHEIILVNDGSADRSFDIALNLRTQDPKVKLINFSRNFGHQSAISAGVDHASGDAVVIIDADLQDPPELIGELVAKWRDGYHVVYAQRAARRGETRFKVVTAALFYRLMNRLSDVNIPADTGDFRLMDRTVVDAFRQLPERNRYVRGLVAWLGFKQCPVIYERDPRASGETKFTIKRMMKFAFDGIAGFSDKPLYFGIYAGLFMAVVALGGICWIIGNWLVAPESLAIGWTSTIVAMLMLGSIQLVVMGVLGLYLARIYHEIRQRPNYVIASAYGLSPDRKSPHAMPMPQDTAYQAPHAAETQWHPL